MRALVVDDSAVVRRLVSMALMANPEVDDVVLAEQGEEAIDLVKNGRFDIVVMDVEMPGMGGIETVRQIRRIAPGLPVIMFSTYTERGSRETVDALLAGAVGYVRKHNVGDEDKGTASIEALVRQVVDIVRLRRKIIQPEAARPSGASARAQVTSPVLGVGFAASTGGPNALAQLFSRIPADLGVPYFIVQHIPRAFAEPLARRLNALSPVRVRVAEHGEIVMANVAYVAPGDRHMCLKQEGSEVRIELMHTEPIEGARPAANPLFASMARVYGDNGLGVVLTGMGRDGLRGATEIASAGGRVWVQDQATSVVWGMPRVVWQSGCANQCLPLGAMAFELANLIRLGGA